MRELPYLLFYCAVWTEQRIGARHVIMARNFAAILFP